MRSYDQLAHRPQRLQDATLGAAALSTMLVKGKFCSKHELQLSGAVEKIPHLLERQCHGERSANGWYIKLSNMVSFRYMDSRPQAASNRELSTKTKKICEQGSLWFSTCLRTRCRAQKSGRPGRHPAQEFFHFALA